MKSELTTMLAIAAALGGPEIAAPREAPWLFRIREEPKLDGPIWIRGQNTKQKRKASDAKKAARRNEAKGRKAARRGRS